MSVWNKQQQGSPDDSITSILQTRNGYLWIGRSGGLTRFDGVKFVAVPLQVEKTNVPVCVTALCEDSAERLWIGTQGNGLFCYEDGVVEQFSGEKSLLDSTINSIAEDANGNLWLGTPTGLSRIKAGSARLKKFTSLEGLPNDFVSSVSVARSGTVWITTRGGTCQFKNGRIEPYPFQIDTSGRNPESLGVYEDRRGKLWAFGDTYLVNLTDNKHLNRFGTGEGTSSKRIWTLCEGRGGELWIGTSGKELYCFTEEKIVPLALHNADLASDVRAIYEDRKGNLWLGTHGGELFRLQARNIRVLDPSVGLPNRPAICLGFNAQSHLWIGFEHGGLYEGADDNFNRIAGEASPQLQNLSSICIAPDSSLWVGTSGSGLYHVARQKTVHYTTANGLSDNGVLSLAMDTNGDGSVWVGTLGGLHRMEDGQLTSFGEEDGLPNKAVTAILPGGKGNAWVGFDDGAVFERKNGRFFHRVPGASALAGKGIRALCEDSAERLWLGTADGHVACATGGRFLVWDLNSGSEDKSVLGILRTDDGDLWFGTERSVYCIAQKDISSLLAGQSRLQAQLIYKADAPSSVTTAYGWPRALKSPDGRLWFATSSGVVGLNLRGPMSNSAPPPVLIEDILVNGRPLLAPARKTPLATIVETNGPIRLTPDTHSLEIQFTALDLSAPEKLRFRHRLEGFDPDWIVDGDTIRNVHYGQLAYGVYRFRVQAGDANQSWFRNEATFNFQIPSPIWKSPWAQAAYGMTALVLAAAVARLISAQRYRRKLASLATQRAMERERLRIAQDMHDEIGSKLTKISFMSERAKRELQGQEPVKKTLDSIAGTSRDLLQTLDEIVWAVNPHNDTLEHLADYLGQYATEYLQNTAVECELHIPRGLPHHPLSSEMRHNLFLAFEESLNNALKHGQASRIRVDMQAAPSLFEIHVEDNGRGFDSLPVLDPDADETKSKRGGNGLRNMSQRLALLGGKFNIHSQPGRGTKVILSVPLGKAPWPNDTKA